MHMDLDTATNELVWNDYYGYMYDYFYIHRGPDPLTIDSAVYIVDSVPFTGAGDGNTWRDTTDITGQVYYTISVELPEVIDITGGKKANSGPFSRSLSNLEDNRQQGTGISAFNRLKPQMSVYPNPATDFVNLNYTLNSSSFVKIEVMNVVGQKVYELDVPEQKPGNHSMQIETSNFSEHGKAFLIRVLTKHNENTKQLILE
jgi:hypothetical protein